MEDQWILDCIRNITQNRLTACSLLDKHHSGRLHCLDTFMAFFLFTFCS